MLSIFYYVETATLHGDRNDVTNKCSVINFFIYTSINVINITLYY
jgi:hypothetical protein